MHGEQAGAGRHGSLLASPCSHADEGLNASGSLMLSQEPSSDQVASCPPEGRLHLSLFLHPSWPRLTFLLLTLELSNCLGEHSGQFIQDAAHLCSTTAACCCIRATLASRRLQAACTTSAACMCCWNLRCWTAPRQQLCMAVAAACQRASCLLCRCPRTWRCRTAAACMRRAARVCRIWRTAACSQHAHRLKK